MALELESFEKDDWNFSIVYFCLSILGHYLPIGAQIYCIKVSIEGNWNELFQSELTQPDDNVSVHSHMFEEFRQKLYQDSPMRHRSEILCKFVDELDFDENVKRINCSSTRVETIPDELMASSICPPEKEESDFLDSQIDNIVNEYI